MIAVKLSTAALAFASRPLSTNTQVSCLPMALCSSAAATDESMPPDSPSSTRPFADLRADFFHGLRDEVLGRPLLLHAADAEEEIPIASTPRSVWKTQVKLDAVEVAPGILDGGEGRVLVEPTAPEAGGSSSACRRGNSTRGVFRQPGEERALLRDREVAVAVFAGLLCATVPPRKCPISRTP